MSLTTQTESLRGKPLTRDHLIAQHAPMARRIARKIARRTPGHLEEDLVSAAFVGLIEAAARFDLERGEGFVAFAAPRIRGAVIDELRRGDILPRRTRQATNQHAQAVNNLQHKLGRNPETSEVAAVMGVGLKVVRRDIAPAAQVSIVPMLAATSEQTPDGADLPEARVERLEQLEMIRGGLSRLEARDARILTLYYLEGLSYLEIGEILGVSESRVCQLCGRAMKRLRTVLGAS